MHESGVKWHRFLISSLQVGSTEVSIGFSRWIESKANSIEPNRFLSCQLLSDNVETSLIDSHKCRQGSIADLVRVLRFAFTDGLNGGMTLKLVNANDNLLLLHTSFSNQIYASSSPTIVHP